MNTGQKRIMVFGTFDGLHPGHLDFFKQARRLASKPYLIVSIARDSNVEKIKGKTPALNETERQNLISRCDLVDEVVLGGDEDHIPHILSARPDIIALGYDQEEYVQDLDKLLKEKNLSVKIIRLKPFQEKVFKNKLLRKKLNSK